MSTLHLHKLLDPHSIVVIGASAREQSPGLALTKNLLDGGYQGELHLVNPRYKEVLGQPCMKALRDVDGTPDLALILTPSRLLRKTLVQCARKGVKVAIVMSMIADSKALHTYARRLSLRLLGPYSAGFIRPTLGINATYSANRVESGSLAVVSQSASLAGALLDWAEASNVGFSALLSTGADTDISLGDILDLLAEDRHTKAIIVYLDRVKGTRAFLSALSATARIKPVILMKSTHDGARYCDAMSRSGQVYSSDVVFHAALARAGVVRIRTFSNLFASAKILASQMRTRGKRLAVISNGAAPALMTCERVQTKGFVSPSLREESAIPLAKALGQHFRGNNPIVLRDPDELAHQYREATQILCAQAAEFDAVLAIFAPDSRNDPAEIARAVLDAEQRQIPLITCWMGEASVIDARTLFADAGIASFRTPEAAADAFDFLHRYYVSQQQLLQLPDPASSQSRSRLPEAKALIGVVLRKNQRVMSPDAARQLMRLLDIEVLPAQLTTSAQEAVKAASTMAQPVAMKLVSASIAYKAAVVKTRLGVVGDHDVGRAWTEMQAQAHSRRPEAPIDGILVEQMHPGGNTRQLAVGIMQDPTFGPVLWIGIGGELTTLIHRRAVQLPPLNDFLIDELLTSPELEIYLGEMRHNKALDKAPLAHILRQLSELACEIPEIFSLDINPLILDAETATAIDVQVVLERRPSAIAYSHLAIHPYPSAWIKTFTLKNGQDVTLRPIRPEDGESISSLVREMSAESRYFRFMHAINELSPQMVAQFTKLDYDRQMAFVAVAPDDSVIGVSRYIIGNDRLDAEFAISISDQWQGNGLAKALMNRLIDHARSRGLRALQGDVLSTNTAMHRLMNSLGFERTSQVDDPEVDLFTYPLPTDSKAD